MSLAKESFEYGIKDAEELLEHFDKMNSNPPPPNAEVLKRAGLVMALTAWETYVEDRVREALGNRISAIRGSYAGNFIMDRFESDIKRFNNPNADKTKQLFKDYLGIDITEGWEWNNTDSKKAKDLLNKWIIKRGEAVHRSKPIDNGIASPHLVKRDELEKTIRFLRDLVNASESYIEKMI
ncbi:MAG: HEPN domain-containing protein [Sulfuricurvum sp.]|uniref:HEPN domain-containing protein n=1 Tax=Sulfuricurvum sp. TaxID=2025608 RepID=UPI003565DD89